MKKPIRPTLLLPALTLCLLSLLSACSRDPADALTEAAERIIEKWDLSEKISIHGDSVWQAENRVYSGYDPALSAGITFEDTLKIDAVEDLPALWEPTPAPPTAEEPNVAGPQNDGFLMRVYDSMPIYADKNDASPAFTLESGRIVELKEGPDGWAEVYPGGGGDFYGWAKDGFSHVIDSDCGVYAVLPVEYGIAKTNQETWVRAYSHLVDIRRYFRTAECRDDDLSGIDLENVDLVIGMKLSTNGTTIHEPFYNRNLCLVQYDLIPMIEDAVERFRRDGLVIVIYDAYRPTSVQQRWFDVVRVHKWVADPSIGMGGVHDRGTALDISLVDLDGNLLEMPTPMHTFTEESSRLSQTMTAKARENMDYMLAVMLECNFTYIQSEWWHFQDVNTKFYLPTDHPIDEIPLAVLEN